PLLGTGSFTQGTDLRQQLRPLLCLEQHVVQMIQFDLLLLQCLGVNFRLGEDVVIDEFPEVLNVVHPGTHGKYRTEFLPQRGVCCSNPQRAADQVFCQLLIVGIPHFPIFRAELFPLCGNIVGAQEGEVLQHDAPGRDVPALLYVTHVLVRFLRFHPDRNDKGVLPRGCGIIPKFGADIGYSMPLAAVPGTVSVLIPLFAVYRAQQCSLALAVAQGVEAFARGEAIPQGVQDRGLAHTVDADQIGDLLDIQKVVDK
ncbi:Transcriptional regulator kdgR, partial [Dysosmobacter welbionis]